MATKKKVAPKAAVKKAAGVKKAAPKKAAKSVAKKAAPAKKTARPVAKPVAAKPVVAAKKASTLPVKPEKKTEKPVSINKQAAAPASKKVEVKRPEQVKPLVKKPEPAPVVEAPKPVITPPPFKQPVKKEETPKPAKVVMPEIKTKTIRKYEPDFTKSVLDTPMQENSGPTQRYSDNDLAEFRELINKKLEAAKKELNYLQGLITRKDEMGGDESDNRYMTMEDGSISMEREQLSQMASRQITFIDHLEKAIMRIENKTYGICRVTGKLIDKARLRAVPHATLSIEAKQTMNK
jgi:RNA polymerase-binding transcription factor DksA